MRLRARIAASACMLLFDIAWIYAVMGPRYASMVPRVQGGAPMRTSALAAAGAYALMITGLNIFVLPTDDSQEATLSRTALRGLLFGIILYGVYDLTCAAVLKDWEVGTALLDIAWGGFVFALCGAVAHGFDAR
jgi:uncharacterized membrane protein